MRVLLLGASSQLGSDIVCLWRDPAVTLIPATRADAAVTDSAATGCLVARVKPGLVINTTVFHNLPQAKQTTTRAPALGHWHSAWSGTCAKSTGGVPAHSESCEGGVSVFPGVFSDRWDEVVPGPRRKFVAHAGQDQ